MTTRRIYYDDAYTREFSARVVHCDVLPPDVKSGITSQALGLVLDQTAFYPTSGGQPHDLGKIGDANVLDVRDEGDDIVHVVDRRPSSPDVLGCIHWLRRFDHMQQHTGQHLVSAVFQERFGRATVSFHLGAEVSTIDLRGPEPSEEVLEGAGRATNQIIFEDRPVTVRYGTAEDLAQRGVRKQVEREGILRAIEIEGIDLQPCGGTHVKSTGQIGTLLLKRCTKMRQDWRVEFVCGARAEQAARQDFYRLRGVADRLSCAPEEIAAALDRALTERDANFKRTRALLQRLAELDAEEAVRQTPAGDGGVRVVRRVFGEEVEPEYLGFLGAALAKSTGTVALLARNCCGNVMFAQHPGAGKDMSALLKAVLARVGGKGGGTQDAARGRLEEPGKAEAAIALAVELLSAEAARS
ncbi:MAG TPA: DHHA1 domain-containing protein [Candidatus Acidoferrum sp.]|nr:DHHA1 domain-containing protein [Candidatus Acidoferrum sp.]